MTKNDDNSFGRVAPALSSQRARVVAPRAEPPSTDVTEGSVGNETRRNVKREKNKKKVRGGGQETKPGERRENDTREIERRVLPLAYSDPR